ncbi:uncharacterized protein G2W53_016472 [Senna tora]|uniref:Uncharacterized protein n=1 Tax=Senna tora TaxID=362788 RepID=A0A834TN18_9FABA|nr:uncharacterized protein G2W53_016472 [Senna tora]
MAMTKGGHFLCLRRFLNGLFTCLALMFWQSKRKRLCGGNLRALCF